MNINFSPKIFPQTAFGKTLKYAVVSAVAVFLGIVIPFLQANPTQFGAKTGIIVVIFVALEKFFDPNIPNI